MKKLLLLPLLLLFTACNVQEHSAKVVDSEVEGLEYQCAGLFEYTDKNGSISCNHMPVAFMLGQIKLGLLYEIPQDSLVLPQDIVNVPRNNGDDKNLLKVLTLLQSLDEDQNPDNGIKIPRNIHQKLTTFIDIKDMELAEIEELIEDQLEQNITFKEPVKVLQHLQKSMKRYKLPELKSKILEEFESNIDNNTSDNNSTNGPINNNSENNSSKNNSSHESNSSGETNSTMPKNSSEEFNNTKENPQEKNSSLESNITSQVKQNRNNISKREAIVLPLLHDRL